MIINKNNGIHLPEGIGVVDMGTLGWDGDAVGNARLLSLNTKIPDIIVKSPLFVAGYDYPNNNWVAYTDVPDKCIVWTNSQASPIIRIKNTSFATTEDLIASFNGKLLFYKKSV